MRKILVLRGGALGDFIVTLPAIALLRRRWPEARIELVGNATAAALGKTRGLLDAVHSQHEARWSALYGDPPLPGWFDEFELVLSYWPDPDGALQKKFPTRAGQTFIFANAMPARAPAAAHYCEPLRALGLSTNTFWYPIDPLIAASAEKNRPGGDIAIHPGSGSTRKNWPADRWAELCSWLKREHRANLLLIAGEAESADALALPGPVAHNLPLEDLAARLAGCRLFIGHDSGVSHLAAACGAPCLLLFGPTDPAMWAPPAPQIRVLQRGHDLGSLSMDEVRHEVAAALADRT